MFFAVVVFFYILFRQCEKGKKAQKAKIGVFPMERGLPTAEALSVETQPSFLEANKALVTNDQMVEHFDPQQVAGLNDGAGYLDVL